MIRMLSLPYCGYYWGILTYNDNNFIHVLFNETAIIIYDHDNKIHFSIFDFNVGVCVYID